MNATEVTMHTTTGSTGLTVIAKAVAAAGIALEEARRVPAVFRSLADQLIRAAASVPANLSEGHGRVGRDRPHHWRIAYGSAREADTFLRLLGQAGAIDCDRATEAIGLFDEVRAMTWRLIHPLR